MKLSLEFDRVRRTLAAAVRAASASWNRERDRNRIAGPVEPLSEEVLFAVEKIRGKDRPPVIFVHGVMTRSGTNYCGDLLRQHSDIEAYPYNLWEVPLLQAKREVNLLQNAFVAGYRKNKSVLGPGAFEALVGAAFVGFMHAGVPEDKRLLVKVPRVSYLSHFSTMFPKEDCLLLLRDGRDVVASSMKTWPGKDFSDTARMWRDSTVLMRHVFRQQIGQRICRMYKFENLSDNPEQFVRDACESYDLDSQHYPFENVATLTVHGSSNLFSAGEVNWEPQEKPKDFVSSGKWQGWTYREKARFKRVAGDVLIESGYASDNNW